MIALHLLLLLFLAAAPAGAQAGLTAEGVWVSATARRLVQSGEGGDPGCFLRILAGGRVVEESCSEQAAIWPSISLSTGGGTVEVRSEGREIARRLVLRPGAPSELEVTIEREGGRDFHRLYRLDARHLPALESLAMIRDRLIGEWMTEDGLPFRLDAGGSYAFGGDIGRFRAEGGFVTAGGAWGALFLEPESGGPVRRYLLHGRGLRLGMAEVPRDVELLIPSSAEEAEREDSDEGPAEEVLVEGIAIPLPGGSRGPIAGILPPGVEEPVPSLWIERGSPFEEDEEAAALEGPTEAEELPAIAQPIRPARKCGCAAAEAGAGIALLLPWLFFARRRK